jgi:fructan beta-fructosidase
MRWMALTMLVACSSAELPDTADTSEATVFEPWRPRLHYSPPSGWLNDPNGLVVVDGVHHLYFQHYPDLPIFDPMHWGHAVSSDLLHWETRSVAIAPDDELGVAFSGSAVALDGSRPGPCTDCIAALLTHHGGTDGTQKQSLMTSPDGDAFTLVGGGPVLDNPGLADFRDPRVLWHAATGRWVMALAAGDHIAFYTSPDLEDWTWRSDFGPAGATGGVWECPELLELSTGSETRWVLEVDLNPGGAAGGSGAQYFVGSFDGTTFLPEHTDVRWVDHGPDFYAVQAWSGVSPTTWVGWMSDWRYALFTPTSPWRGAMSLPREVGLVADTDGVWLTQQPIAALASLHTETLLDATDLDVPGPLASGSLLDIALTLQPAGELGVVLSVGQAQTTIGWRDDTVFVDRTQSGETGFHSTFAGTFSAPGPLRDGAIDVRIIVDTGSVEVFADGGRSVITALIFAPEGDLSVDSYGTGTLRSAKIRALSPAQP